MPIPDYPFITVNTDVVGPAPLIYLGGPNARPYLWLRIINPATRQSVIVPAAVDTGADALAIPAEDAETLGHNLTATPPRLVKTAKGYTESYPHTAAIDVLDVLADGYPDESAVLYPIPKTLIYLTVGQKAHLVGQGSFLSTCILSINYPEKRFSVRLPN